MSSNKQDEQKIISQQESEFLYNERVRYEAIKARQVRLTTLNFR